MSVVNISSLSSKAIRLSRQVDEDLMICVYKAGLILTPGEVTSWTKKLRKLTRTRHRNILLRLVHGDIFSNSSLTSFGLINDSKCLNCPEPNESIAHRVVACPEAVKAWEELERAKMALNLNCLSDLSMENLVGAKDDVSKLELTLQAELIHRLTSSNKINCPKSLVKTVVKFIGLTERIEPNLKLLFDVYLRT